jgi:single-strand DNA-binding protein
MNDCFFSGRITAKPEFTQTQNGNSVSKFNLAVSKKKRNGEETTQYIRIIAWNRLAEVVNEYLDKGRKVFVKASVQTGKYQDKDGKTVYTTDFIASDIEFGDAGTKHSDPKEVAYEETSKDDEYDEEGNF